VDPDLPWPDVDVMVVVGNLVAAYDEAHAQGVAQERERIAAAVDDIDLDEMTGLDLIVAVLRVIAGDQP
jgi:hypothetical protein